ncbi:MAG: hypothetical protein ACREH6_01410 [Geminicoccaceae bacterium]
MAYEADREEGRQHRPEQPTVETATQARQSPDKAAIWIWLATFVAAVATVYLTL